MSQWASPDDVQKVRDDLLTIKRDVADLKETLTRIMAALEAQGGVASVYTRPSATASVHTRPGAHGCAHCEELFSLPLDAAETHECSFVYEAAYTFPIVQSMSAVMLLKYEFQRMLEHALTSSSDLGIAWHNGCGSNKHFAIGCRACNRMTHNVFVTHSTVASSMDTLCKMLRIEV